MGKLGVVCLLALAACYRGPSGLSGYCAGSAESCVQDAPPCGVVGNACCETEPACSGNAYCAAGVCESGCVTEVGLGRYHICVIEHDHTVWCSGHNDNGELGNGSAGTTLTSTFVQARDASGPITDATAVCAGYGHTCAVRAGGAVSCWGTGGNGQLGNNAYADSPTGVSVVQDNGSALTGIAKLACGHQFTCALATDASVWCWGYDNDGELGDNSTITRATAKQVPNLTGVVSIATGHYFACALDTAGAVHCWGYNNSGQIGDGTQNTAYVPVGVTLPAATALATGPSHACALLADSSIECWGSNTRRWLGTGNGRNTIQVTPAPVITMDDSTYKGATAIALGSVSCALHGANVDCWGDDVHGQTGNGGAFYPRPVQTSGHILGGVDRITAHFAHVCAHQSDGDIVCWGRNEAGEFGDGTYRNHGNAVPLGATCAPTN